jgi:hypothetical protein
MPLPDLEIPKPERVATYTPYATLLDGTRGT